MVEQTTDHTIREAVAVFEDVATLKEALNELEESGVDRADTSLLTSKATVENKLRHLYAPVEELEGGRDTLRKAFVSSESVGDGEGALIGALMYLGASPDVGAIVASGRRLATAITGAAAAGGSEALIGGVLARLVGNHRAEEIGQQLKRGGLLLWVRVHDAQPTVQALKILERHCAHDVHIHELPVVDIS